MPHSSSATMESKKRKREEEPPRVTFIAPGKTFERLLKEPSLEDVKGIIRKKLGLTKSTPVELIQVRGDRNIDLEDDDDYEAFCQAAKSSGLAEVRVSLPGSSTQSNITLYQSTVSTSEGAPQPKRKKKKRLSIAPSNGEAKNGTPSSTLQLPTSESISSILNVATSSTPSQKPVSTSKPKSSKSVGKSAVATPEENGDVETSANGSTSTSHAKSKSRVHFVNSTEDLSSSAGHQKDPGPSTAISATPASAKTSKKRKRGNSERDRDNGENSGGSSTQNTTSNGDEDMSVTVTKTPATTEMLPPVNGIEPLSIAPLSAGPTKNRSKKKRDAISSSSFTLQPIPDAPSASSTITPEVEGITTSTAMPKKEKKKKREKKEKGKASNNLNDSASPIVPSDQAISSSTKSSPANSEDKTTEDAQPPPEETQAPESSAQKPKKKKKSDPAPLVADPSTTTPDVSSTTADTVAGAVQRALASMFGKQLGSAEKSTTETNNLPEPTVVSTTSLDPSRPQNPDAREKTASDPPESPDEQPPPSTTTPEDGTVAQTTFAASTKKVSKSRGCLICHSEENHTGFHCPVIKDGSEAIRKRIEEAKQERTSSENRKLIARLETWLTRSLKEKETRKKGDKDSNGASEPTTDKPETGLKKSPKQRISTRQKSSKNVDEPRVSATISEPANAPSTSNAPTSMPNGNDNDSDDNDSEEDSDESLKKSLPNGLPKLAPEQEQSTTSKISNTPNVDINTVLFSSAPVVTQVNIPKNLTDLLVPQTKRRLSVKDIVTPSESESDLEKEMLLSESDEEVKRGKSTRSRARRQSSTPPLDDDDSEDTSTETISKPLLVRTRNGGHPLSEAGVSLIASAIKNVNSDVLPTFKSVNGRGETASTSFSGDEAVKSAMADDNKVFVDAMKGVKGGDSGADGNLSKRRVVKVGNSEDESEISETDTETDVRKRTHGVVGMNVVMGAQDPANANAVTETSLPADAPPTPKVTATTRATSTSLKETEPVVLVPATQTTHSFDIEIQETPSLDLNGSQLVAPSNNDSVGRLMTPSPPRSKSYRPGTPGTARRMKDRHGKVPPSPVMSKYLSLMDSSEDEGEAGPGPLPPGLNHEASKPVNHSRSESLTNSDEAVSDAVKRAVGDDTDAETIVGSKDKGRLRPFVLLPPSENLMSRRTRAGVTNERTVDSQRIGSSKATATNEKGSVTTAPASDVVMKPIHTLRTMDQPDVLGGRPVTSHDPKLGDPIDEESLDGPSSAHAKVERQEGIEEINDVVADKAEPESDESEEVSSSSESSGEDELEESAPVSMPEPTPVLRPMASQPMFPSLKELVKQSKLFISSSQSFSTSTQTFDAVKNGPERASGHDESEDDDSSESESDEDSSSLVPEANRAGLPKSKSRFGLSQLFSQYK